VREPDGTVKRTTVETDEYELCETAECYRDAVALCDCPVKDGGRYWWCDRRLCESCAEKMATGQRFCPPHARAVRASADSFVTVCAACGSPSCAQKLEGYACEARDDRKLRVVSRRIWKDFMAFAPVKW